MKTDTTLQNEVDRETAKAVLKPVVKAARDEGKLSEDDWEGIVLDSIISADLSLSTTDKTQLVNELSDYQEVEDAN